MKRITIARLLLVLFAYIFALPATAQVHAHLKLWDRKYRYPRVNVVEFQGDVPQLASYDAVYGHGAMWENEWIGFRVYVDYRQSVDLYGKKHPQMELDSINFYSTPELMAQGFGEDILFVGPSVGAGSFRGYEDGAPVFVNPVKARGQRVLNEGPDTAVVEIYASDWQYKGRTLQFRQRFTAIRGHREVQVDVWLEGCTDEDVFATGVQKLERNNKGLMRKETGLVGSWGANVPDKENHPELVETLGIGLRVSRDNLLEVKEDALNYLCLLHPVHGHIRYWVAAASDMQEEGEAFHSATDWFRWLKRNL